MWCAAIFAISFAIFNRADASSYFDTTGQNLNQLNVLQEYDLERYSFPAVLPTSEAEVNLGPEHAKDHTVLYRIASGPKSPKAPGKTPVFIQHGILCDSDPCVVNKPKIAVAYILVDQGYDIWLGISNSSLAENSISSEENERKHLERIAQYILASTQSNELIVMGYFNGSVQFFGMTAPTLFEEKKQSRLSRWFEHIPGVKFIKKYILKGANIVSKSVNDIQQKINYITDDSTISDLKKSILKAWGFVTTMVIPTLSIQDFSSMINNPDVYLDTTQLIRKYGYRAESHQLETKDGYLLTVHRIRSKEGMPENNDRPVVLLQHGLLGSSADWVVLGPEKSLAYLLSDEGYDVWLGNSRGNTFSRAHVNLTTNDPKFWEFSWHEMGVYDLPVTVDHILNVTKQKKIFYVGHSQGATNLFVFLSENPEYNEKLEKVAAYAPVAYTVHTKSPIINVFSSISTPLYYVLRFFRVNDFLPTNTLLTKMGRYTCEARTLYQVVCSNILFMMTGYDISQMNTTLLPVILEHVPAGSSVKQFFHFAQEFKSKKFRQFDYGSESINKMVYNQAEPPDYKLENVRVPVAIFYADNDLIADVKDVEKLAEDLPNVQMLYKIPLEHFNHIGFTFGNDARPLIYEPTVLFFKKNGKN